jgi:hypothetical protein
MRWLRAALFLALLLPGTAQAAITIASGALGTSSTDTFSESVTCNGSDRALLAFIAIPSGIAVTGATYNGVAMSLVDTQDGAFTTVRAEIWKLSNPASGANTLQVTLGSGTTWAVGALCFNGAEQTTASLTGTVAKGQTGSVDVSSASGEIVIDLLSYGFAAPTVGAGQTAQMGPVEYATDKGIAVSSEAGAATVTMSWNGLNTDHAAQIGVSVKPSAGGGETSSAAGRRRIF